MRVEPDGFHSRPHVPGSSRTAFNSSTQHHARTPRASQPRACAFLLLVGSPVSTPAPVCSAFDWSSRRVGGSRPRVATCWRARAAYDAVTPRPLAVAVAAHGPPHDTWTKSNLSITGAGVETASRPRKETHTLEADSPESCDALDVWRRVEAVRSSSGTCGRYGSVPV